MDEMYVSWKDHQKKMKFWLRTEEYVGVSQTTTWKSHPVGREQMTGYSVKLGENILTQWHLQERKRRNDPRTTQISSFRDGSRRNKKFLNFSLGCANAYP